LEWENVAVESLAEATLHGRLEPKGPAKHATRWTAAGARTLTDTESTGTGQLEPRAFQ